MKRNTVLVVLTLFVIFNSALFAEEKSSEEMSSMMDKCMMMQKAKMMPMMKEMQGMMVEMMSMMKDCRGMKKNKAMMKKMDEMMACCEEMMAATDEMMPKCMMMKKGMTGKEGSEKSLEMPSGHGGHH